MTRSPTPSALVGAALASVLACAAGGCSGGDDPRPASGSAEGPDPTNVLLIVVDTLRADHLSCYGSTKGETPNLDALARRGVLFERAYSHIPITGPSHASLFTALLPLDHGVRNNAQVLSADRTTLAELLARSGRSTAAFVSLGVLAGEWGFAQGFERYVEGFHDAWYQTAEEINREVLPWVRDEAEPPFFLWVHYSDPHEPYTPPSEPAPKLNLVLNGSVVGTATADGLAAKIDLELRPGKNELDLRPLDGTRRFRVSMHRESLSDERIVMKFSSRWRIASRPDGTPLRTVLLPARVRLRNPTEETRTVEFRTLLRELPSGDEIRRRYAGEVRYVDAEIGRLLQILHERGFESSTLVVFTADHGEGLGDHGEGGHINQLYDHGLRVPLILSSPGRLPAGMRVADHVRHVDVLPTVLDLLGEPVPEGLRGRSMRPLVEGGQDPEARPVLASTHPPEARHEKWALVRGVHKLISTPENRTVELYNLDRDPREKADLVAVEPELAGTMTRVLTEWGAQASVPAREAELSEDDRMKLEGLGYVR